MYFVFALITAWISFASLPTAAQSGRTFYIDYASGSNSNAGTSTGAAWKSHPYMRNAAGCAGAPHAYTPQAGDRFIFKGGVTWPNACFAMILGAGGTSGAQNYYGVDKSWYSGGSWTRPIFDLQNTLTSGDYRLSVILIVYSYITFDNLEIKNQLGGNSGGDPSVNSTYNAYGTSGVIIENGYNHGYTKSQANVLLSNQDSEGGVYGASLVDHMTFSDSDGGMIGQPSGSVPLMGCAYQVLEFRNSTCDTYAQGVNGGASVHDNEFSNGKGAVQNYVGVHTNDIQDTWEGSMAVYNNLLHDSNTGQHIAVTPNGRVYNNVIWNISGGSGGTPIGFDTGIVNAKNYPGSVGYALNNTIDCRGDSSCINTSARSGTTYGTVYIKNNILITDGTAIDAGTGGTQVRTTNYPMPTAEATTYGFTIARKYYPSSSGSTVVGQATNLSSSCSASLAALCYDTGGAPWYGTSYVGRPSGTLASWNAGAYEFSGQQSSNPAAPSGLVAILQ